MRLRELAGFSELRGGNASLPSIFDAAGQLDDSKQIADYMEGASFLAVTGTRVPDVFDDCEWAVSIDWMTDGAWTWSAEVAHYVRTQSVMIESDFLDHVRQRNYVPPALTDDELIELSNELMGPPKSAGE